MVIKWNDLSQIKAFVEDIINRNLVNSLKESKWWLVLHKNNLYFAAKTQWRRAGIKKQNELKNEQLTLETDTFVLESFASTCFCLMEILHKYDLVPSKSNEDHNITITFSSCREVIMRYKLILRITTWLSTKMRLIERTNIDLIHLIDIKSCFKNL